MKGRFIELWKRIGAQSDPDPEFTKLQTVYSQPQRFYHNIKHIGNCLVDLDSAKHLTDRLDLVELAIWYHDVIYDTQAKDNEEKSAQLAYDVCMTAKLPEELAKEAAALILATKHRGVPDGMNARILVDVDLSILGKQVQEFDEYEKNIRKEYSWVSEDQFKQGRSNILQMFLHRAKKDALYSTDFFRNKYEAQAKRNLQRSIDSLLIR